jgi:hypothetical protein
MPMILRPANMAATGWVSWSLRMYQYGEKGGLTGPFLSRWNCLTSRGAGPEAGSFLPYMYPGRKNRASASPDDKGRLDDARPVIAAAIVDLYLKEERILRAAAA